jgi:hypothetical protein
LILWPSMNMSPAVLVLVTWLKLSNALTWHLLILHRIKINKTTSGLFIQSFTKSNNSIDLDHAYRVAIIRW